ncbi:MAG: thioredoxin family protein, partial [Methanomassiliicoccales archaeon]
EYDGKVSFAALDVDSNMETAQRFGIMAIPNLLFLRGTELVDQIVGVVPKEDIERKIAEHF